MLSFADWDLLGDITFVGLNNYKAVFSDDVKRLRLKNHSGNRHVYLFIKVAILQQKAKYEYGYKFNEEHMRRQLLFLPAKADGQPDYAYMEMVMLRKESKQLARYAKNHPGGNPTEGTK